MIGEFPTDKRILEFENHFAAIIVMFGFAGVTKC